MNRVLVIVGAVFVVIGLLLMGTFPWAFYKSARDVDSDSYEEGAKLTVYGKITDMEYSELLNITVIELDHNLTVYAKGEVHGFDIGDFVFLNIVKKDVIQFGNFRISAWETSQKDIHHVSEMQTYFYILMAIGAIVVVLGALVR